jgi:hypothetical protein
LKETQQLGKYLGVPALGRAPKVHDFQYLVEHVKARLTRWKAKQLSLAGRCTLARSVIQPIPVYPMMTTPIPKSCLKEIEKAQRPFVWGDTEDKRKAHTISWEVMNQPKRNGGMGFRKLQSINEACLMKLGWSRMTGEKSLWGDVLVGKYGREGWGQGKISVTTNDSSLWKAIAKCWDSLELHRCWAIGDGSRIHFWSDKWIDESTRLSELERIIPKTFRQWKVKDVVTTNGEWNFK